MNKEKTLSMLGLARRAGKLAMGHDAAVNSLISKKSRLLVFAGDVSPRLVGEFEHLIEKKHLKVKLLKTNILISEIHFACGYKAGVISVEDENFGKKIISLSEENKDNN